MGELLGAPQWQGIGALAAIVFGLLAWLANRSQKRDTVAARTPASPGGAPVFSWQPTPSVGLRLAGALLVLVVSYTLFAGVWAVLAFVLEYQPSMVIASSFAMFAAPPGFLALAMRWPFVGGFVGGGAPMSLFALYHAEEMSGNMQIPPPALAWFVVFFIIGGMLGALTAGPTVIAARSLGMPLPRNYRRAQPVSA